MNMNYINKELLEHIKKNGQIFYAHPVGLFKIEYLEPNKFHGRTAKIIIFDEYTNNKPDDRNNQALLKDQE